VLDVEVVELEFRALVSAAFIAYLPKEPEDSRQRMLASWSSAVGLEKFDVLNFLVSESNVLTWKKEGLSPDTLSLQNALVVEHAVLTPYFIDPSSTATTWLAEHLKEGRVEVISQQDSNFSSALELAVRFGKTLIIQEMDAIDPVL
jgi:dynein heavy chain 2